MAQTPFFPAWRSRLAPLKAKLGQLRALSLCQLENLFADLLPIYLLSPSEDGPNSRQRLFTLRLTFWSFLWQVLKPKTSCREVVRQVQALFALRGHCKVQEDDSPYCQARARLPRPTVDQALQATALEADRRADHRRWFGRPVVVVDGSSTSLPDTPANQRRFPQPKSQAPGCGFPLMKLVAFMSLASGAILAVATGSKRQSELRLFRFLWHQLKAADIVLGDDTYSDYPTLASLPQRQIDGVFRLQSRRPKDFRRGKKLGPHDRLITLQKPKTKSLTLSARAWKALPQSIDLRLIRYRIEVPGFRTRQIDLLTTLLDPHLYPAQQLAALFGQRWRMELCLRDLKTTLGMEQMRCKSPEMAHKELLMYLIAHNLIRCLMAQAARLYEQDLQRISFKGTVDTVRQYSAALAQARNRTQRRRLRQELLDNLARDLVPERPNRREPRALKRRPKQYPLLNKPRHLFKEIPHRSRYRKNSTKTSSVKNKGLI